ncbi:phage tail protein, partial [Escherichia coli]
MPVSRNLCIFLNVGLGELALAGATTGAMLVNGYVAIPL